MNKKYVKPETTIVNVEYDKHLLAASDPAMTIAGDSETPTSSEVTIDGDVFFGNSKSTSGDLWDEE